MDLFLGPFHHHDTFWLTYPGFELKLHEQIAQKDRKLLRSAIASEMAQAAPIVGGWLFKKKGTGGWKKLWAIMYGYQFTWFETPNLPEAPSVEAGAFDVNGAKCLPMRSDKGKWKFSIESSNKQLILYVEDETTRNQWINGIRNISEGKFLKGQLQEKPTLKTKDGNILTDEEAKRLAKRGQMAGVVAAAPPQGAPIRPANSIGGQQGGSFARSPYQIDELRSPSSSTSSTLGKQLKWEVEEARRDLVACNLAKERNTFGGAAEIDSDENDWIPEEEDASVLASVGSGCKQQ